MNIRTGSILVVAILIAVVSPSGALDLQFKNEKAVGLCCLKPGRDVLFFGLVWQERPWVARISVLRAIETVPEGKEAAWYAPDIGVPFESYWIGADISEGTYAVESRTNKQLEEKNIPPENMARNGEQSIVGFDIEAGFLEAVVVRPGVGAWAFTGGDGSTFDGDGQADGWVRAELPQFTTIGIGPGVPQTLVQGDVILALDTWRGILSTTTIDG